MMVRAMDAIDAMKAIGMLAMRDDDIAFIVHIAFISCN